MKKEEIQAIALMVGGIIGAGILALPYAISQSGITLGVLVLVGIGLAVLLLNLYMGEIVLRTKRIHQLTGYAEKYLGKWAKKIITLSMFIGLVGALVAYLIGEGEALHAMFGWNKLAFSLLFFAIMTLLVFFDLGAVAFSEVLFVAGLLGVIAAILAFSLFGFDINNLAIPTNISKVMIPYGVALFAIMDLFIIPEAAGALRKNKRLLKKNILIGILIPLITYVLFSVIIVGATGLKTSEVATVSLGELLGKHMVIFGNLFAVFAMATSFLALGLALKWILTKDYGWKNLPATALACGLPLAIFLSGITSFVQVITIAGAIAGGIEGIFVVLMFHRAKKLGERKPEYTLKRRPVLDAIIVLMFAIGIAYTLLALF